MGCFWENLALCHILIGYEADVLGIITYVNGDQRTQALLIVAFVVYTISAILMAITKFTDHRLDLILAIFVIIFLISAGKTLSPSIYLFSYLSYNFI